ncbi:hypothetical protein KP79_PYT14434 [Mizuhopecten yessoensis]|uniref:Uncharacterized protein n=1 Tax=Mizuhopecten yessoensis TaxID=6573 RepID=A0A210Q691_MIZYE|nr:hypothetical protein KP79_PYT14434 [Mizuhopecten yessoensis]
MCKELNSTTTEDFTWSSLPYPMEKPEMIRHPRLASVITHAKVMKRSSSAGNPRESNTTSSLGTGKTGRSSSFASLVSSSSDDNSNDLNCIECGGRKKEDSRILKGNNIQSFYTVWKIRDTGKKLVDHHHFKLPSSLTRNDSHRTCGCMTRTHKKHTDSMCCKPKYCACLEMSVT